MQGRWESYISVRKRSLSCLVCFHFKLIILSNSLCLHYSLIPLSSLIKRAFIFSLIFIYLFIYVAFLHETASPCVESKLLIVFFFSSIIQMTGVLLLHSWAEATEGEKWKLECLRSDVRWPDVTLQVYSSQLCVQRLTYSVQYKQLIYST